MSTLAAALLAELSDTDLDQLADLLADRLRDRLGHQVDEWLDVPAAAGYLKCPKSRLYALTSAQRIPGVGRPDARAGGRDRPA